MTNNQSRGAARKGSMDTAKSVSTQDYYQKSWAVVIGINNYQGEYASLYNARNDAEAMAHILREIYKFDNVYTLYDEAATQGAILEWLRDNLPDRTGPNDRLVFFFAGHGTTDERSERGYLIPYGARQGKFSGYVDMDELRKACQVIPAKHVLIVLDCCFSGVAAVASRAIPKTPPTLLNDAYLKRITAQSAWQILTAGDMDDLVADSGMRPGHSAFTSALLEGLEGGADTNEDGIITATELANYVKPQVARHAGASRAKGQMPFFNYLAGSKQGDFVLLRPGQEIKLVPASTWQQQLPLVMQRKPWTVWGVGIIILMMALALGYLAWDRLEMVRRMESGFTEATHAAETAEAKFLEITRAAETAEANGSAVQAEATSVAEAGASEAEQQEALDKLATQQAEATAAAHNAETKVAQLAGTLVANSTRVAQAEAKGDSEEAASARATVQAVEATRSFQTATALAAAQAAESTRSAQTAEALASAQTAEAVRVTPDVGNWIVVFGGDVDLEGAEYEANKAAEQGYTPTIYLNTRNNRYVITVGPYLTQEEAEREKDVVNTKVFSGASTINLKEWCPNPIPRDGYKEC